MHNEKLTSSSTSIAWLFKMAWRDSRKNRSRLLLFISSIVLGIAALVAVYSFKDNLQKDIDNQAKELTGADLTLESRQGISKPMRKTLDSLGDERSEERTFPSMIYFQKSGGSRLIQMKALQGEYPYYGKIATIPANATATFRNKQDVLVDQTLMLEFKASVGDSVKIGDLNFKIAGIMESSPGQTGISSSIAPIVYMPLQYLDATNLVKTGSRISYKFYYKYNDANGAETELKKLEPKLQKEDFNSETVASKKESTGRSFENLSRFLSLSGFIALLLGCIGVGSSVYVYIQEKLGAVAILRCLGLKARDAFFIYLIQIGFYGLMAAFLGAILGSAIQFLLPLVLKDFLPIEINVSISWSAIAQGILLGFIISILFALPALLSVRKISPLNAIRSSFEGAGKKPKDWLIYLVYVLMMGFIFLFTYLQMQSWTQTAAFTISIAVAFILLYLLSKFLMFLVKKLLPQRIAYVWRQGFANLYRPNNQTLMLTVAIGLSTTFICTLYFVQAMLIEKVKISGGSSQPNMVLFDIQTSQLDGVEKLANAYNLPIMSKVPVITMRIEKINGKTAKSDSTNKRAYRNEIRSTYQESLTEAETISAGKWVGRVDSTQTVIISLEERYAKSIGVKLKDTIVFDVQGLTIPTVVGSLRAVNWTRFQTNFRVVFPAGVLEDAPKFNVITTRVPSPDVSAKFQGNMVKNFPNVSVIDLNLALKLLDDLFDKISFVIRFMAGFSMATGWIVLVSAVLTSKSQRIKESILLRTLGASRKQITGINAIEYLFLGLFAAAAGLILAFAGSWALAKFVFSSDFIPPIWATLILFGSVLAMVVLTGVLGSRNILNQPPLKILRQETN
ncbi:putative ABC transport system permease protein [Pedobacter sp. UYEF25]